MTSPSQQDDYYAQVQNTSQSGSDDKKPIKLKLKVVVKKPEEKEDENSPLPSAETPSEVHTSENSAPKARLVTREHASE